MRLLLCLCLSILMVEMVVAPNGKTGAATLKAAQRLAAKIPEEDRTRIKNKIIDKTVKTAVQTAEELGRRVLNRARNRRNRHRRRAPPINYSNVHVHPPLAPATLVAQPASTNQQAPSVVGQISTGSAPIPAVVSFQ